MRLVELPQRKGRLPYYARNQLLELQHKFEKLEALKLGVFERPEDANISVQYFNPSFLVKNPIVVIVSSPPSPMLADKVSLSLLLCRMWTPPCAELPSGSKSSRRI